MPTHAARTASSPVEVTLADLVRLRPGGESLKLTAPRIRVAAEGGHVSPYKGRGVEFDESRPYQPGDDLRTMDWRVTARTGKPHTKVFREERNRPVFVWLDLRRPMLFATRGAYKGVRAAEVAALVAWSAVANGRLGGLVFSETEHHELRPALGLRSALRLFQKIAADSHVGALVERRAGRDRRRARVVEAHARRAARQPHLPLSDFAGSARTPSAPAPACGHCDLMLVHFFDPVEAELPPPGRYRTDRRPLAPLSRQPLAARRVQPRHRLCSPRRIASRHDRAPTCDRSAALCAEWLKAQSVRRSRVRARKLGGARRLVGAAESMWARTAGRS
jgi:uncharacterized protein (DUF58 family)